jgi:hypothetical protein
MGLIDDLLRRPTRILHELSQAESGPTSRRLVLVAVALMAVYGVVIGSFSGGAQWWAVPVKVVAGMLVAGAICLPSLYIFSCLSGSAARLAEVTGALGGLLALMTLLLTGFAPVAWLFSQSTDSEVTMGVLHLLFWIVGMRFGVRFLKQGLQRLGLSSELGVNVWV